MSRAVRIAWALTIALAAYVVPLRIAELAAHRAAYIAAQPAAVQEAPRLAAQQPHNVEPRS